MSAEDMGEEEIEGLADYHCVAAVVESTDPHAGEVHKVVFDPEVLDKWVYRELLDVIEADGYKLVGFSHIENPEEADFYQLTEEHVGAPLAAFVYRGDPQ